MTKYTVAGLLEMEDSELMDLLGLQAKLDDFKSNLNEASALEGKKLKDFETSLNSTLNPSVYVDSLKHVLERAQRSDKEKSDSITDCMCH